MRDAVFEERWVIGGFSLLGAFTDLFTDLRANEYACEFVRKKIRAIVHDAQVAATLCPSHPIGCKRLCVDTDYYATYNRDNVTLVDVNRAPIERIAPHGVVAGGREHAADLLVLATGFDAFTGPLTRIDLRGRGGLHIRDKWQAGPLNYLGLAVAGFPNLFNLVGAGSTSAFTSVIVSIEHHIDWIADCLQWMHAHGHTTIEPTRRGRVALRGADACHRAADHLPQLQLVVPRRQHPGQAAPVHADGRRLSDVRRALRRGGARRLQRVRLALS